ncbi:PIN domain-containing protein [Nitrospira sp. M1]
MLIDTDVLIWFMRGNVKAQRAIDQQIPFSLSVVTYIELVQGMRNQGELVAMRTAFRQWEAKVVYLTEEISSKAMLYVERYALSHSLHLADALIGATAVACSLPLLTANTKHYRVITDIDLRTFRP